MPEKTAVGLNRVRSVLLAVCQYFAATPLLAAIVAVCTICELSLLGHVDNSVFHFGTAAGIAAALAVLFLWISFGWLLWLSAQALLRVSERVSRWVMIPIYCTLVVGFAAGMELYLASWCLFFKYGRFASLEALQFIGANSRVSWMSIYFLRTEHSSVLILGLGAVTFLVATPLWFRFQQKIMWSSLTATDKRLAGYRLAVPLSLLLAIGMIYLVSPKQSTKWRKALMANALRQRLSPTATLASSWYLSLRPERVDPILNVMDLHPLEREPWKVPVAAGKKPPSVIFVAIESLRPDALHLVHQGKEVMPHMAALARNGVEFSRAYSQSTHSDYADVCIVSSLFPLRLPYHHYYKTNDPWPKTTIYDVLKPAGYATAIISSQNEHWGCMDNFLDSPSLDLFFDAERSGAPTRIDKRDVGFARQIAKGNLRAGKLDDKTTADVATTWVKKQLKQGKPIFISMNLQSSHFPYSIREDAPRPFQPCEIDFEASFGWYPPEKVDVIRNAYYNAVHECDAQLGRLVETLRECGELDNTFLVVMGENGEAFHENGGVCHAGKPTEPQLRVACVLHAPKYVKPGVDDYPVELVDIVPTVLGKMGVKQHPNFQGINVLAGDRPKLDDRLLFFHTESSVSHTDAVLLAGRWKLFHDRESGVQSLFDVVADPKESKNLIELPAHADVASRLHDVLAAWRSRQLSYYRYSSYYGRYYPPQAPTAESAHKASTVAHHIVTGGSAQR